jgi:predicted GNAT family acetyltransferase
MATSVRWVLERSRYEITLDGEDAGYAEVRDLDGATAFTHTVVDTAFEDQGVGGDLVRAALDDVAARGGRVVPLCTFVRGWSARHEEYADLVDTEALARRRS